jgi:purine-binding chemotaxis protein CheW
MSLLHVLFKVAEAEYVLPASEVLHMESYTGATRVPGTAAHVAGLVQVRGRVLPVIDLRVRFGLEPHRLSADSRLVVAQRGERPVALLADSAREVLRIDPALFRTTPELGEDTGQAYVKAIARAGDRLVMLLDLARVVGEEPIHAE